MCRLDSLFESLTFAGIVFTLDYICNIKIIIDFKLSDDESTFISQIIDLFSEMLSNLLTHGEISGLCDLLKSVSDLTSKCYYVLY